MTVPEKTVCPSCFEARRIVHYWRTDTATLRWIDDYKCLDCGHRWMIHTQAFDYEEHGA
jgi:Zn ribbon nucleic-acid-binding protein